MPANSEAALPPQAVSADSAREGAPARVAGVGVTGHVDGVASYRLPSGSYRPTSRPR
ncbi:hypothetical protein [Streptomyces hawaiiensis]|uniref:hypothetical protein n=1 Tax=Streptomyces hawaiiensis TaxID=67305 RepID=UPI00365BB2D1